MKENMSIKSELEGTVAIYKKREEELLNEINSLKSGCATTIGVNTSLILTAPPTATSIANN
jgi:hypothetical protein